MLLMMTVMICIATTLYSNTMVLPSRSMVLIEAMVATMANADDDDGDNGDE